MEDKYEKLEKLGDGTYGKVYKATGQLVAFKKTRLEMDEKCVPPTALREVSLLQMLSHSLYVELVDDKKNDKPLLYLVFEYLDTDLKKYVSQHQPASIADDPPFHRRYHTQPSRPPIFLHESGIISLKQESQAEDPQFEKFSEDNNIQKSN
ncbi:hypothetical protein RJ640_023127 [Escallonia rubra]|uniref:cyclin-dependent kinase n=1 Tax=Escallonia rubra TaxID=112253 RepID=A0AA88UIU6_9ASTE|nr:hypothetical protein RJ640_023127 [Escallonia rubra]